MAKLGTFSFTDSGVQLTRGRGAAKTVVLDVSFKELEVWAAQTGVKEKQLFDRSFGRACRTVKKKFEKVVTHQGGVEGVPKFKDFEGFTRELRRVDNSTAPLGGKLAHPKSIRITRGGLRNTYYVGWIDPLRDYAIDYQEGVGDDEWLNNNKVRRYLHMRGIEDIPRVYVSNPRRVIPEPFGKTVAPFLLEWARKDFYKSLARMMAKSYA